MKIEYKNTEIFIFVNSKSIKVQYKRAIKARKNLKISFWVKNS